MKRHTLWLAALAALLFPIGCTSDTPTVVPAQFAVDEGDPRALRNVIAFFTRQFSASGDVAIMKPDGSHRRPLSGSAGGFEPALAPDGRRIVFSRVASPGLRDIVLMNVDGTGATPLVRGLVLNGKPSWSPDGCRIAFRSTRDKGTGPLGRISIINVDGSDLRQLTSEPGPGDFAIDQGGSFSPDGNRLAFTRNLVLHVINIDGTGLVPLPNEDRAQSPVWSPDGQRIAYMSMIPFGDIHVRNADGSNLVRLITTTEFESLPQWSPDGRRLVFSRRIGEQTALFTIDADGTGEVRLTPADVSDFMPDWGRRHAAPCDAGVRVEVTPSSASLDLGETLQFTATVQSTSGSVIDRASVEWSSTDVSVVTVTPSGLVTAVGTGTAQVEATFANATGRATVTVKSGAVLRNVILYGTEEFGLSELAVVAPDGTGRRRLTTDGRGYFAPDISPDGRRIAFVRFGGIFVMKADGTDERQLFSGSFPYAPAWSPDGSRLAFRGMVPGPFGNAGRIFVINADGTGLRQVSPDDPDPSQFYYFDEGPTWSPDGFRIAFARNGALTIVNVDGTGITTLPTPEGAQYPSWSRDATRIAYTGFLNTRDVFVSNADGSNPVRVTTAPEQENNPRWSPDSGRLVFCRVVNGFFQLFIINADGTGETRLSASPQAHECSPSWSRVP